MPLDEATRRLMFLLQRDLRRLVERERARTDRQEEVRYDSITRMATWETRRGDVIGRWYGEILASYVPRDRILRWAWAGRGTLASSSHAEIVFREGQARGVAQLTMSVVGDLDEEEASTLARLGALVARGEGVEQRRSLGPSGESEVSFVGLFDSSRPREPETKDSTRYSVPPPPVQRKSSPPSSSRTPPSRPPRTPSDRPSPKSSPPGAPYRSLPPIREIYGPRNTPRSVGVPDPEPPPPVEERPSRPPPPRIREPSRALFVPVASGVVEALTRVIPGFQQALFVITIHTDPATSDEKRRLVVMLVAVDASGTLRALDPSQELVDITARMIEADRAEGNGPWRKLSARITPKPDGGATLHVDVV